MLKKKSEASKKIYSHIGTGGGELLPLIQQAMIAVCKCRWM